MTCYRVIVTRAEDAWMVQVPGVERVTQARTLAEVDTMARDLIEIMTGEADIEIEVRIELPESVTGHLQEADRLRAIEARSRSEAARHVRDAAAELRDAGLSLRDLGTALGVSHQRAGKLLAS